MNAIAPLFLYILLFIKSVLNKIYNIREKRELSARPACYNLPKSMDIPFTMTIAGKFLRKFSIQHIKLFEIRCRRILFWNTLPAILLKVSFTSNVTKLRTFLFLYIWKIFFCRIIKALTIHLFLCSTKWLSKVSSYFSTKNDNVWTIINFSALLRMNNSEIGLKDFGFV